MNTPFTQAEVNYLLAWAKEDSQGSAHGPARTLQRQNGIQSPVLGQLFARLSTVTGRSQYDLVEDCAAESSVTWPWPSQEVFEARLIILLPPSTMHYLEKLGALMPTAALS